jgi:diacylglycerol kinase family enzyme
MGKAKDHNDLRTDVRFNRFLVIVNPAGTNLRFGQKKIAELQRLAGDRPIDKIETSAAGHAANVALLASKASGLGPKTLLCIAAGDGTINAAVEALLQSKALNPNARRTPILPLWGGNANDLAWMLNGLAGRTSLDAILKDGQIVPIRPLHIRLTGANGSEQTHIAASTISFGASAKIMQRLNSSGYRQSMMRKLPGGKFLKEAGTAWKTAMVAPAFAADEQGTPKVIYEYTIANGSRIAKHYRMPVRLADEQFYFNSVEGKRFFTTATALMLSFNRRLYDDVLRQRLEFAVHEDVWAQFDGEAAKIPAGTKVKIEICKRPFYALSTLLHAS